MRDGEQIDLASQDAGLKLTLARSSTRFLLALLDKLDRRQMQGIRYRILRMDPGIMRGRQSEGPSQFREMARFRTVQLSTAARMNREKLRSIAEAGLFNVSYAKGIGLRLSLSWERSYSSLGAQPSSAPQFPQRIYNSDLLAYYQLGLSSDSLILAYLSFYQILERFYVIAAEKELHERLRDKLVTPTFSHRHASQLRELAAIVRKFDQKTDELKMLTLVLQKYFMPDELADWISEYERASTPHLTVQQSILGSQHKVDLNAEQIAPTIAKRIYYVRNALVHNKEGDLPRFIPFRGQDDVLSKELPLVKFIAEQLIIKTGEDL